MRQFSNPALVILSTLVASSTLLSCAASKFTSQKRADLGAFSSQTAALLGDFNSALDELRVIRLRDLLEPDAPEEALFRELITRSREGRVFLINFSLRLSHMPKGSQKERVAYFADLIDGVAELMENRDTLPENVLGIPAIVREQSSLVRAANESIPMIQVGMDSGIENLNQIDKALEALIKKLERKIDERHADALSRARKLHAAREDLLDAVEYVGMARRGDEGARAMLLKNEAVLLSGGIPEGADGLQQLLALLIERVDWVDRIKMLIKDDLEAYREDHEELDRVHLEVWRLLNQSRVQLVTWMLGYSRMASGVTEPADWFDLSQTTALLIKRALP